MTIPSLVPSKLYKPQLALHWEHRPGPDVFVRCNGQNNHGLIKNVLFDFPLGYSNGNIGPVWPDEVNVTYLGPANSWPEANQCANLVDALASDEPDACICWIVSPKLHEYYGGPYYQRLVRVIAVIASQEHGIVNPRTYIDPNFHDIMGNFTRHGLFSAGRMAS